MTVFADDVAAVISDRTYLGLKRQTNKFLSEINEWAKNRKMTFNKEKTEIMFFGKKGQARPTFKFENVTLHCTTAIRYLGVHIDQKFRWDIHINKTVEKARKLTHMIRAACRTTWSLDRTSMKIIYECAIKPAVVYGKEIWGQHLSEKFKTKLNSVQRVSLIAAAAYRTVSTNALQVISKSIPLDLYIEEENRKYKRKAEQTLNMATRKQEKEHWKHGTTDGKEAPRAE